MKKGFYTIMAAGFLAGSPCLLAEVSLPSLRRPHFGRRNTKKKLARR